MKSYTFVGVTSFQEVMRGSTPDFTLLLLSHSFQLLAGAAVNEKTHTGETALHLAGVRDHSSIVSILIENNIDVDAVDENLNNGQLIFFFCLVCWSCFFLFCFVFQLA